MIVMLLPLESYCGSQIGLFFGCPNALLECCKYLQIVLGVSQTKVLYRVSLRLVWNPGRVMIILPFVEVIFVEKL